MPVDISRFVFGQRIITIAIGRSLLAFFEFDLGVRLRRRDESVVTIRGPGYGKTASAQEV
jgi:hypothetical protein